MSIRAAARSGSNAPAADATPPPPGTPPQQSVSAPAHPAPSAGEQAWTVERRAGGGVRLAVDSSPVDAAVSALFAELRGLRTPDAAAAAGWEAPLAEALHGLRQEQNGALGQMAAAQQQQIGLYEQLQSELHSLRNHSKEVQTQQLQRIAAAEALIADHREALAAAEEQRRNTAADNDALTQALTEVLRRLEALEDNAEEAAGGANLLSQCTDRVDHLYATLELDRRAAAWAAQQPSRQRVAVLHQLPAFAALAASAQPAPPPAGAAGTPWGSPSGEAGELRGRQQPSSTAGQQSSSLTPRGRRVPRPAQRKDGAASPAAAAALRAARRAESEPRAHPFGDAAVEFAAIEPPPGHPRPGAAQWESLSDDDLAGGWRAPAPGEDRAGARHPHQQQQQQQQWQRPLQRPGPAAQRQPSPPDAHRQSPVSLRYEDPAEQPPQLRPPRELPQAQRSGGAAPRSEPDAAVLGRELAPPYRPTPQRPGSASAIETRRDISPARASHGPASGGTPRAGGPAARSGGPMLAGGRNYSPSPPPTAVDWEPPTASIAELGIEACDTADAHGVVVAAVDPHGPAAAAGWLPGDHLTALDGVPLQGSLDLARQTERCAFASVSVTRVPAGGRRPVTASIVLARVEGRAPSPPSPPRTWC